MSGMGRLEEGFRTPRSFSSDTFQNTAPTPKQLNQLLEQAASLAIARQDGDGTTKARDYINGGAPHVDSGDGGSATSGRTGRSVKRRPLPLDTMVPPNGTENISLALSSAGSQTAEASPAGQRNVQFATTSAVMDRPTTPGHTRAGSWEDAFGYRGALISKLKAFASPGTRASTSWTSNGHTTPPDSGSQLTANSPITLRQMSRVPTTLHEEDGSDADAEAEETADEGANSDAPRTRKKRRRVLRPRKSSLGLSESGTAANTPQAGALDDHPLTNRRTNFARRRATMGDMQDVVSEGEGRERLRQRAWKRGASFVNATGRFWSEAGEDVEGEAGPFTPDRGLGHARRRSAFGSALTPGGHGGVSDGDTITTPRRPFLNTERASSYGAQKWKQVKNTLRQLRQKKDDKFDYFKSTELMAELRAGAPAVLMLASMLQRDEHGNRRIPVLLEQVRLRITDSRPSDDDDDTERHWLFTINLEYGSGPSRMRWTIVRSVRDIYNLHFKYKYKIGRTNDSYLHGRSDSARPRQPKFPWVVFPYLRSARNVGDDSEDEEMTGFRADDAHMDAILASEAVAETTDEGAASDVDSRNPRRRSRGLLGMGMNMGMGIRRKSTGLPDQADMPNSEGIAEEALQSKRKYADKQRKYLEKYIQEMIRWLMFRADSNRLCRFLELSALGVRLAAEGSYHGKECYLHIQSSKGIDFRRVLTPAEVMARHTRKWFLVRQSYIVCVESPENMNVYDVYLVDSKFRANSTSNKLKQIGAIAGKAKAKAIEMANDLSEEKPTGKHHRLILYTAERKVKLFSRYQTVMKQFEHAVTEMLKQTPWHLPNRFNSFAPVRTGVFAQWLVDGRDYMWNVSRAIDMAKDVVYIHDWWLSPELYMRRPPCISQKWRLDRLLQRKAREGVKIFIIIYRNVEAAVPIDSEYTKFSLLNLHPNIFVQRSPNQFKKNQFFFAHHEKLVVVDHDMAFVGGIDLCFGRWDCPQHPLPDDKPTGFEDAGTLKDAEHCQLFPGKDYSNPRVQDFFRLNEPYEEMYDRSVVPRMPWHDVGMQIVGQPARDLTRHFVQRWNYLRRGRKPTRPLPFLLPAPDARVEDLEALGFKGTCEVQLLRSASTWSSGLEETEMSIQTAYIKIIEDSEHFVYIENQFFISSTIVANTQIQNRIGDALVGRILRAHEKGESWKCVILIPLMPGFQSQVTEQDGTSIRVILQCQFRTICRGDSSIFGRLRAAGVEPESYIQFFSLRQWGIINGVIKTEQLYIHAKTIIADDRVALIGSANINERSMVGERDSEVAAIVRDTDMIQSIIAGKPYLVARFAHTLRMRLMREHLGLDVDEIADQERKADMESQPIVVTEMDDMYEEAGLSDRRRSAKSHGGTRPEPTRPRSFNHDGNHLERDGSNDVSPISPNRSDSDPRVTGNMAHELEVQGYGPDHWRSASVVGLDQGRDSVIIQGREVLVHNITSEGKGTLDPPKHGTRDRNRTPSPGAIERPSSTVAADTSRAGSRADQDSLRRHGEREDDDGPSAFARPLSSYPSTIDIELADVDKDCMRDPLDPLFYDHVWSRVADNNTRLYRRVFRCQPDNEVGTWAQYTEFKEQADQIKNILEGRGSGTTSDQPDGQQPQDRNPNAPDTVAAAGIGAPGPIAILKAATEKATEKAAEHIPEIMTSDKPSQQTRAGTNPTIITPDGGGIDEEMETIEPTTRPMSIDIERTHTQHPLDQSSPDLTVAGDAPFPAFDPVTSLPAATLHPSNAGTTRQPSRERHATFSSVRTRASSRGASSTGGTGMSGLGSIKHRKRAATRSSTRKGVGVGGSGVVMDELPTIDEAEELMDLIQGTLVTFPYDWLWLEEANGNWGFQVDGVAPLSIYD